MLFQSDMGPIYYEVHGPNDAPAIIFNHGAGLNHGMFDAQVAALKDKYRVVTWDMPGHGSSVPLEGKLDVAEIADYVIDIMDEINMEKAVTVGQSLGSWVSQLLAIRYPERFTAIVSIGGQPIDKSISSMELLLYKVWLSTSKLFPGKTLFSWTARNKTTTPEARQFAEESMTQIGKKQFLWTVAGMLEAGNHKGAWLLHQPLLITHGEHEMPKSVSSICAEWHANVPGSRYVVIPDAGHNANQDNPHAFNQALLEFLEDTNTVNESDTTDS